jgi:hypothetical protein
MKPCHPLMGLWIVQSTKRLTYEKKRVHLNNFSNSKASRRTLIKNKKLFLFSQFFVWLFSTKISSDEKKHQKDPKKGETLYIGTVTKITPKKIRQHFAHF